MAGLRCAAHAGELLPVVVGGVGAGLWARAGHAIDRKLARENKIRAP